MSKNICGIDFGTSNSTIGILKNNSPQLVCLEQNNKVTPSAIFYDDEEFTISYGRAAIDSYKKDHSGRLLQSLKSVLGTDLMDETTMLHKYKIPFTQIIGKYLSYLKDNTEINEGVNLDSVVLGRPINFVDDSEESNKLAQDALYNIALNCGFKNIEFQYEPIAASLKYELSLHKEELVMIIDIGGGTTDISIVQLSPDYINIADRSSHCLANTGVRVGGTNFDKNLSLNSAMLLLGYKQTLSNNMPMPKYIYFDAATWHRINNLYTPEFKKGLRLFKNSLNPIYYNRLEAVVKHKLASHIAFEVEKAKIELSNTNIVNADFSIIEPNLSINISKKQLQHAIDIEFSKIDKCISDCLNQANITKDKIDSIFLTGGSSQSSIIKQHIQELFPNTKIDNSDSLSSVGTGLVIDAIKKFK